MFYHGYIRRGGCPTCGGGGNRNFRNVHSPSFYNNRNTNTFKNNYDLEEFESSFSPYNNNRQRIMTPPRNISNYNFDVDDNYNNLNRNNYQNYHSPQRNAGCRSCSMGSNNVLRRNDYQRPTTGYPMRRTNNINTLNSMNFHNDNYNYNFRKRYDNDYDDDINDDIHESNRYNSPLRNPQRNLQNSFSSENVYNNSRINTNNNYSYNNNGTNNLRRNNNHYNVRSVLNNNKYRSFFNDNFNRNDDDDNDNVNNNNNNRFNNYFRGENRNYYSMKNRNMDNYNNTRNNFYLNSRYNYLKTNENSKNDYSYNDDRFITLNIFNYPGKIRDMIQQRKSFFVYIYGSHDYTGQSWCSDCNIARPNVEEAKKIIKNKRYQKEVYFMNIPIEKIYMEDFKDDPIIQLERVPTLIYYENGLERGRLIENDLFSYESIRDFMMQAYNDYNDNIEYNKYNMTRSRYLYRPRIYY
jgi:hypothetical protein